MSLIVFIAVLKQINPRHSGDKGRYVTGLVYVPMSGTHVVIVVVFLADLTGCCKSGYCYSAHDDVIKWKHFPRYWPFVRGIHRSPVNSLHIGQWRGALMFSLICAPIKGWVNNGEAGDLRRYRSHYDVTVMVGQCRIAQAERRSLFELTNDNHGVSIVDKWLCQNRTIQYVVQWSVDRDHCIFVFYNVLCYQNVLCDQNEATLSLLNHF